MKISHKIISYKDKFYQSIMKLDQAISCENREVLLREKLHSSKVFYDNHSVKGFYIPDLVEGPIIAENEDAGIELMKYKYSSIDHAVIPSENKAGIDFLKQNGFIDTNKKGTRMIRGKDLNWYPEKVFSRIGGNFG